MDGDLPAFIDTTKFSFKNIMILMELSHCILLAWITWCGTLELLVSMDGMLPAIWCGAL
jgi:hypothetical protein